MFLRYRFTQIKINPNKLYIKKYIAICKGGKQAYNIRWSIFN